MHVFLRARLGILGGMSQNTVLLTLGRLPPAVDIARSFAAAGWRVVVAEPFKRHMAGTSRAVDVSIQVPAPAAGAAAYLEALRRVIADEDIDLVVPVSEETMHVAQLRDALASEDGAPDVYCAPGADTLALHSKHNFIALAHDAGLAVPDTARVGTPEAAALVEAQDVIVKPEFSCSGRGLQRVTRGSALPATDTAHIVQSEIVGDEVSGFAMARAGRVLVSCAYRATVRHGSVAVAFERFSAPAVEAWIEQFVAATAHTGFIAFDFIIDADGVPRAIECNPRATSGLHFVAQDDIAAVITGAKQSADLRDDTLLQEFWSNWTHWFASLRDGDERRRTGWSLRRARDVTWQARDPGVFLLATWSTWPIIGQALKRGETFAEVLALDIEYQPEEPAEA
ncbi:MAG: ATP-grasp domain-containing protein [Pseudomonadota bacterium]